MFRLIGFQCVITKASAERAFHLSASLSLLDREEMRLELGDAEAGVLNHIYPKTILEKTETVPEKFWVFFNCFVL